MTMITPSYLGETIEYSSLHACRSTLEDPTLLLVAAMIAFPAPWKRRLVGIVSGVGLLSVVNLLRIVALYQINIHAPRAFEFIHAEVFPLVMVVLAVGAFGVWSRWSRQVELGPIEAPPNAEA